MKAETTASGASVAESPASRAGASAELRLMRSLLIGIFVLLVVFALYFARAFFMPVILAFLLALTLTPIVRFLRMHGIPDVLSATFLVLLSVLFVASAGYLLSGPVIELINNTSSIGQQLTERLAPFKRPLERIMDISRQLEALTETTQEPGVQKVAVASSGILPTAASNILEAGTSITVVFVLLCDVVEGQFVTPTVIGRRLELNTVAIFIAIAFWSWLWGFVGALMAVPLLVVIKVLCDHFDGLSHVGNFLAAQQAIAIDDESAEDSHKSGP